jgi:hypothetical protein
VLFFCNLALAALLFFCSCEGTLSMPAPKVKLKLKRPSLCLHERTSLDLTVSSHELTHPVRHNVQTSKVTNLGLGVDKAYFPSTVP